jgi:hypothetical protein
MAGAGDTPLTSRCMLLDRIDGRRTSDEHCDSCAELERCTAEAAAAVAAGWSRRRTCTRQQMRPRVHLTPSSGGALTAHPVSLPLPDLH